MVTRWTWTKPECALSATDKLLGRETSQTSSCAPLNVRAPQSASLGTHSKREQDDAKQSTTQKRKQRRARRNRIKRLKTRQSQAEQRTNRPEQESDLARCCRLDSRYRNSKFLEELLAPLLSWVPAIAGTRASIRITVRMRKCPDKGTWCSGITSAPHAEGPGFKSQCFQVRTACPSFDDAKCLGLPRTKD